MANGECQHDLNHQLPSTSLNVPPRCERVALGRQRRRARALLHPAGRHRHWRRRLPGFGADDDLGEDLPGLPSLGAAGRCHEGQQVGLGHLRPGWMWQPGPGTGSLGPTAALPWQ